MLWINIDGYEGKYQVTNCGQVRSLSRTVYRESGKSKRRIIRTRILKQFTNDQGYCIVGLHGNGKFKSAKVHRLIAASFLGNPNNFNCVNHKNGIKTDNRVENLEWCTPKENIIHAFRTGLMNNTAPLFVQVIKEAVKKGFKQSDIAKYFRIHYSTVYRINLRTQ
ncbi:MAG: NUMOD4 domain-containing protein [Nitrososphaeraceae archaeon]|nr:NUMOD4 domain-containing protein [Nitrososphaeraceae archaeon]